MKKSYIESICRKLGKRLVKYSFISAGNHNEAYFIQTTKKRYVLKIGNNLSKLKREFDVLNLLNGKFAPKAYLFDKSCKLIPQPFLVEDFLVGTHPPLKPNKEFIINMAHWYKILHKIKSPDIPQSERKIIYSLSEWCNHNYDNYRRDKRYIGQKLTKKIDFIFNRVLMLSKKNDAIFKDRINFSLNQNDPSKENIFINKGKIKLIDWEFSGFGLYERDILVFFNQYNLKDREKDIFLKSYGGINNNTRKRLDLLALILLYSDICYLVERLKLVKEGKIKKKQQDSSINFLLKRLNEIIDKTNNLLSYILRKKEIK